jgi:sugar phosphate isomerase/epimerase
VNPHPVELGIFARTFRRATPGAVAAAVASAGFGLTQLNLNAFGLATIPDQDALGRLDVAGIRAAFAGEDVEIWGVSATYNTVHPDRNRRTRETAAAAAFIPSAAGLGARVVTLCTGTRDPADLWRGHPDNDDPSAWRDLRETLDVLLPAAAAAGVRLGVEPESGNVVRDAVVARRLLDELGADAELVGIVLDPANLVEPSAAADQDRILAAAFDILGEAVVCLHAKDTLLPQANDTVDLPAGGSQPSGFAAAGTGLLDYDLVFDLHGRLPQRVPVIIQDAAENDVARTRAFLLEHARSAR